jgi:hypothetical protein
MKTVLINYYQSARRHVQEGSSLQLDTNQIRIHYFFKVKDKAIPVTGRGGP